MGMYFRNAISDVQTLDIEATIQGSFLKFLLGSNSILCPHRVRFHSSSKACVIVM